MVDCLLGIDAGNTKTKASLFGLDGVELGRESRRNPIHFPAPGYTERDPERMWNDTADDIKTVIERTGRKPSEILAVSVTGYGSGAYLVDETGDPVRPGIMSTDSRASGLLERWGREGLAERNQRRIQQRFWAGQTAPLLGWLAENEPEVVGRTHAVLLCKDFLRLRLCGDVSTDATDAAVGGLTDVERGQYARDMLSDMDLLGWADKLPPIGSSTEIVGKVSEEASRRTGLQVGTPVVRGLVDVTASALATGVERPDQLSVVAGTFSINSTLHTAPRTSHLPFIQSAYPSGSYYLATEGSTTSAGNLDWVCRTLLRSDTPEALGAGRAIYDVCNELVERALGRRNDILFFPFLFGGPGGAPAGMLGLTAGDDQGDILRAVYEGIVFAHTYDIEGLMSGPDGAHPTSIRLAGGGARSVVWAQMFADALGLPVEVTASTEPGALGAAMCAAVGVGAAADLPAAVKAMCRTARTFVPNVERGTTLRRKLERYRTAVTLLGGLNQKVPA